MKKWLILLGILVSLGIGVYLIMSFQVVKLIQSQLEKRLGSGLTLAEVKVNLTHLSAKKVHIEDSRSREKILQIEKVKIYPSFVSLLKSTLRIREMTFFEPSFFFYRSQEGIFSGPWVSLGKGKKEKGKEEKGTVQQKEGTRGEPTSVRVDRILVQGGSVHLEDKKTGEPPAKIALRELDLEVRDIRHPSVSTQSLITLKGKVEGGTTSGTMELAGWIDLATLNLEVSLKVEGMDVKVLEPYYRKKVSARIEDGKIRVEAKIHVKEKRMEAQGQLELFDFRMQEEGTVFRIPAKDLVPLLKRRGYSIKVPFHVKGNMEDPDFNLQEVFLTRIALSLASSLGLPIRVVGEGNEGWVKGLQLIEELLKRKKEK